MTDRGKSDERLTLENLEGELKEVFARTRDDVSAARLSRLTAMAEDAVATQQGFFHGSFRWILGSAGLAAAAMLVMLFFSTAKTTDTDKSGHLAMADITVQETAVSRDTEGIGPLPTATITEEEWAREPLLAVGDWSTEDEWATVASFDLFYEPLSGVDEEAWEQAADAMLAENWD